MSALVLLLAGCSDDGGEDTDPEETDAPESTEGSGDTTTTPTTTTAAVGEPFEVEDSPVATTLTEAYGPPGADPIVEPESAGVLWYDGGETWVAVFVGLDLDGLGPLCPGSSIETAPGSSEFVSNTPTEDGACEGFTNPEATVRGCGAVLVYESHIPMDATGTLYGSIERPAADGSIEGITSRVEAEAASAPPIDPTASAYTSDVTTTPARETTKARIGAGCIG